VFIEHIDGIDDWSHKHHYLYKKWQCIIMDPVF
jgi:hypothetical protein